MFTPARKCEVIVVFNLVNLLLNSVQEKYISDGALLLAVRPLRIGSEKISSYKFEPSKK